MSAHTTTFSRNTKMSFEVEIMSVIRERTRQLNDAIFQTHEEIYTVRSLDIAERLSEDSRYRVITLKKSYNKNVEERVQILYKTLKNNLLHNEELLTDNRCFTIKGKDYKIVYCIETYKKNTDRIWYIENGEVCTSLINRMGIEVAFKWLKYNPERRKAIGERMYLEAMIDTYPNPADRFVASVNIEKHFIKQFEGSRHTKEEIKQRLSQRAGEYFMFMDD